MLSGDPVDTVLNIGVFIFLGALVGLFCRQDLPGVDTKEIDSELE